MEQNIPYLIYYFSAKEEITMVGGKIETSLEKTLTLLIPLAISAIVITTILAKTKQKP